SVTNVGPLTSTQSRRAGATGNKMSVAQVFAEELRYAELEVKLRSLVLELNAPVVKDLTACVNRLAELHDVEEKQETTNRKLDDTRADLEAETSRAKEALEAAEDRLLTTKVAPLEAEIRLLQEKETKNEEEVQELKAAITDVKHQLEKERELNEKRQEQQKKQVEKIRENQDMLFARLGEFADREVLDDFIERTGEKLEKTEKQSSKVQERMADLVDKVKHVERDQDKIMQEASSQLKRSQAMEAKVSVILDAGPGQAGTGGGTKSVAAQTAGFLREIRGGFRDEMTKMRTEGKQILDSVVQVREEVAEKMDEMRLEFQQKMEEMKKLAAASPHKRGLGNNGSGRRVVPSSTRGTVENNGQQQQPSALSRRNSFHVQRQDSMNHRRGSVDSQLTKQRQTFANFDKSAASADDLGNGMQLMGARSSFPVGGSSMSGGQQSFENNAGGLENKQHPFFQRRSSFNMNNSNSLANSVAPSGIPSPRRVSVNEMRRLSASSVISERGAGPDGAFSFSPGGMGLPASQMELMQRMQSQMNMGGVLSGSASNFAGAGASNGPITFGGASMMSRLASIENSEQEKMPPLPETGVVREISSDFDLGNQSSDADADPTGLFSRKKKNRASNNAVPGKGNADSTTNTVEADAEKREMTAEKQNVAIKGSSDAKKKRKPAAKEPLVVSDPNILITAGEKKEDGPEGGPAAAVASATSQLPQQNLFVAGLTPEVQAQALAAFFAQHQGAPPGTLLGGASVAGVNLNFAVPGTTNPAVPTASHLYYKPEIVNFKGVFLEPRIQQQEQLTAELLSSIKTLTKALQLVFHQLLGSFVGNNSGGYFYHTGKSSASQKAFHDASGVGTTTTLAAKPPSASADIFSRCQQNNLKDAQIPMPRFLQVRRDGRGAATRTLDHGGNAAIQKPPTLLISPGMNTTGARKRKIAEAASSVQKHSARGDPPDLISPSSDPAEEGDYDMVKVDQLLSTELHDEQGDNLQDNLHSKDGHRTIKTAENPPRTASPEFLKTAPSATAALWTRLKNRDAVPDQRSRSPEQRSGDVRGGGRRNGKAQRAVLKPELPIEAVVSSNGLSSTGSKLDLERFNKRSREDLKRMQKVLAETMLMLDQK
ncbi:unnamed protein product, partial [Amoebophrya sp. A120]